MGMELYKKDEFDVDDVLIYREDGFWYVEK